MFGGKKRRLAIWSQVATDLGGVHNKQTKWWRGDEHIFAVVRGAEVKLDVYVVSTGKSTHTYTRVAADFLHGPGPKMKLSKQGFWQSIGKALGMQDIATGDAAFDKEFVLKSDSIAVARRLWSDEARARMPALRDTWIACKPHRLELIGHGRWEDPQLMKNSIALVGVLASTDIYGIGVLREVGSVTQPEGERPRAELDTGARVVVMAEDHEDRLVMSARVYDPIEHEPLTIDIVDGQSEQRSRLPQGAQVHLGSVGTATLSIGNTSSLIWKSFELDPARLRAGAALLGAFSVREGVYR